MKIQQSYLTDKVSIDITTADLYNDPFLKQFYNYCINKSIVDSYSKAKAEVLDKLYGKTATYMFIDDIVNPIPDGKGNYYKFNPIKKETNMKIVYKEEKKPIDYIRFGTYYSHCLYKESGNIYIKQYNRAEPGAEIFLHPSEVDDLIEALKTIKNA